MRGAGSSGARANLHFSVSNCARHGFFFAVAAGRRENGSDARDREAAEAAGRSLSEPRSPGWDQKRYWSAPPIWIWFRSLRFPVGSTQALSAVTTMLSVM